MKRHERRVESNNWGLAINTDRYIAGDSAAKASDWLASLKVALLTLTVLLGTTACGGSGTSTPAASAGGSNGGGTTTPPSGTPPQAPTNVLLALQGLSSLDTGLDIVLTPTTPNTTGISWTQAAAGSNAIAKNNVYRSTTSASSGFTLLHSSSTPITTYTDTTATNSVNGNAGNSRPYYKATTYWYKVTAVDTAGLESAQSDSQSYIVFADGKYHWGVDLSYGVTANYKDASGAIAAHIDTPDGGFQPTSGLVSPEWNMWGGAFKYFQFDLKPYATGETFVLGFRIAGDINPYDSQGNQILVSIGDDSAKYGPVAQAGQWTTYKVPLADLITDYGASGAGPAVLESAIYKFLLADQTGQSGVTFYLTNIKFTP